jgi:membrane protease YdiL (CAAX protease family)
VPDRSEPVRAGLAEPLLAFATAIAVAAGLYWAGRSVGFVQQIMHGVIACMFLFGPQAAARLSGQAFDERAAGIFLRPIAPGLRILGLALLATWPAFIVGFFVYYGTLCPSQGTLHAWAQAIAPICSRWHGMAGMHLRLPEGFWILALSQILIVAVPEEVFFRGYLMSRFEARWPSRRRSVGGSRGMAAGGVQPAFCDRAFPGRFSACSLGGVLPRPGVRVDAQQIRVSGAGSRLPRPMQPAFRIFARRFLLARIIHDHRAGDEPNKTIRARVSKSGGLVD